MCSWTAGVSCTIWDQGVSAAKGSARQPGEAQKPAGDGQVWGCPVCPHVRARIRPPAWPVGTAPVQGSVRLEHGRSGLLLGRPPAQLPTLMAAVHTTTPSGL